MIEKTPIRNFLLLMASVTLATIILIYGFFLISTNKISEYFDEAVEKGDAGYSWGYYEAAVMLDAGYKNNKYNSSELYLKAARMGHSDAQEHICIFQNDYSMVTEIDSWCEK